MCDFDYSFEKNDIIYDEIMEKCFGRGKKLPELTPANSTALKSGAP